MYHQVNYWIKGKIERFFFFYIKLFHPLSLLQHSKTFALSKYLFLIFYCLTCNPQTIISPGWECLNFRRQSLSLRTAQLFYMDKKLQSFGRLKQVPWNDHIESYRKSFLQLWCRDHVSDNLKNTYKCMFWITIMTLFI